MFHEVTHVLNWVMGGCIIAIAIAAIEEVVQHFFGKG
jgi:hypothetical protein